MENTDSISDKPFNARLQEKARVNQQTIPFPT
jgi:hypothetical protein